MIRASELLTKSAQQFVYMYMCMYVCMYVCMRSIGMYALINVCMYSMYISVCTYKCMYVCTVCTYLCIYVNICMYLCICRFLRSELRYDANCAAWHWHLHHHIGAVVAVWYFWSENALHVNLVSTRLLRASNVNVSGINSITDI